MATKIKIYAGASVLLVLIIFLIIFTWQSEIQTSIAPESANFKTVVFNSAITPAVPESESFKTPAVSPTLSFSSLFEKTLLKPIFLEPILEIQEFAKLPRGEAPFWQSSQETISGIIKKIQQKESSQSLVFNPEQEKRIFNQLFPPDLLEALMDTQENFIAQGFLLSTYQKIEEFDSEEKIFSFINTTIDVFEKQEWSSKEEAEKFRKGANETWKQLLEEEKKNIFKDL